jgi:hypothetical protein
VAVGAVDAVDAAVVEVTRTLEKDAVAAVPEAVARTARLGRNRREAPVARNPAKRMPENIQDVVAAAVALRREKNSWIASLS